MANQNALAVRNETAISNRTMSIADVLVDGSVWQRANEMGKALMKTSYLGRGTTEFGATMAVLTMAKNNLDPVEFSRAYNMIGDKPEMKPNYALGLFKHAGGRYKIIRADEDVCEMWFRAPDGTEATIKVEMERILNTDVPWTTDKAGNRIVKSNWANHPDDMLFARCTGKALRRVWPEHMGGSYLSGEIDHETAAPVATQPNAPRKHISLDEVMRRAAKPAEPATPKEETEAETVTVDVEPVESAETVAPTEPTQNEAATPEPAATDAPSDFDICPIEGNYHGVRFDEMEPDILECLLDPGVSARHPELTPAHIERAQVAKKKIMENLK